MRDILKEQLNSCSATCSIWSIQPADVYQHLMVSRISNIFTQKQNWLVFFFAKKSSTSLGGEIRDNKQQRCREFDMSDLHLDVELLFCNSILYRWISEHWQNPCFALLSPGGNFFSRQQRKKSTTIIDEMLGKSCGNIVGGMLVQRRWKSIRTQMGAYV